MDAGIKTSTPITPSWAEPCRGHVAIDVWIARSLASLYRAPASADLPQFLLELLPEAEVLGTGPEVTTDR
jgi:hypothetical protein